MLNPKWLLKWFIYEQQNIFVRVRRLQVFNVGFHFQVLKYSCPSLKMQMISQWNNTYKHLFIMYVLPSERGDSRRSGVNAPPHREAPTTGFVFSGSETSALTGPYRSRRLTVTGDARHPRPRQQLRRTQSGSATNGHHRGGPERRLLSPGRGCAGGKLPSKRHSCQVLRGPHRTGNAIPRGQETSDEAGAH